MACIKSDRLSWLRTGATSAVATDYCARADASTSREAVADVVCTATTADAAVFDGTVYRDRLSRRT